MFICFFLSVIKIDHEIANYHASATSAPRTLEVWIAGLPAHFCGSHRKFVRWSHLNLVSKFSDCVAYKNYDMKNVERLCKVYCILLPREMLATLYWFIAPKVLHPELILSYWASTPTPIHSEDLEQDVPLACSFCRVNSCYMHGLLFHWFIRRNINNGNVHMIFQHSFFFFFFFFLDLLKEVESSLRTDRDCLASQSQVSDSMSKQTRLPTKPPPKEDKTKNNMSKGKEPISPKTPMQS